LDFLVIQLLLLHLHHFRHILDYLLHHHFRQVVLEEDLLEVCYLYLLVRLEYMHHLHQNHQDFLLYKLLFHLFHHLLK
jgi:hypothetical protein